MRKTRSRMFVCTPGYVKWHELSKKRYDKGMRQRQCEHGFYLWHDEKCKDHRRVEK